MSTRSGRKTTALATRRTKEGSRAEAGSRAFTPLPASARSAKAPASALEVIHGLVEVLASEIGPEHVRDPELGIGELPEEEVRDAELPARPDQEIRIRQPVRIEHAREELLVDPLGGNAVLAGLGQDAAHRVHD